jgi:hypothetical protein
MDSDDSSNDWSSGDEPQREYRNVAPVDFSPRTSLAIAGDPPFPRFRRVRVEAMDGDDVDVWTGSALPRGVIRRVDLPKAGASLPGWCGLLGAVCLARTPLWSTLWRCICMRECAKEPETGEDRPSSQDKIKDDRPFGRETSLADIG